MAMERENRPVRGAGKRRKKVPVLRGQVRVHRLQGRR